MMAKSKSSQFAKTPTPVTDTQEAENLQIPLGRRASRSWSFSDRLDNDQTTPLNSGLSQLTQAEVSPTTPTGPADKIDSANLADKPDVHRKPVDTLVVCGGGLAEVELILDEINNQEGTDL